MPLATRGLTRGELGAVVAGQLREKRRQRAVDEVHDPGVACAGQVVGRDELGGDGVDVSGLRRGEKRERGGVSHLRRTLGGVGRLDDLRQGQRHGADGERCGQRFQQ